MFSLLSPELPSIACGVLRHKMLLFDAVQRGFQHMPRQGLWVGRAQLECWLHQANNRVTWLLSHYQLQKLNVHFWGLAGNHQLLPLPSRSSALRDYLQS